MGLRNGGWCLGCSWALMAALFALGVMSLTWMGVDRRARGAREGRALAGAAHGWRPRASSLVLAVAILAVPHEIPGFVVPGSPASPHMMKAMG